MHLLVSHWLCQTVEFEDMFMKLGEEVQLLQLTKRRFRAFNNGRYTLLSVYWSYIILFFGTQTSKQGAHYTLW